MSDQGVGVDDPGVTFPSRRPVAQGSTRRLFVSYAAASLVPVLLLGGCLLLLLDRQAADRGLAEGASQARLVARTGIGPLLAGHPLSEGLRPSEVANLDRGVGLAREAGQVLRLRLRDLEARVVFSPDGAGLGTVDEDALRAVRGDTVTRLTYLNSDAGDSGARGPRVVEAYTPLYAAGSGRRIGVLEVYLPYAPIAADLSRGQVTLTVTLTAGLAILWLVLLGVSMSVMRRLRQQSAENAWLAWHDTLTGLPNRTQFVDRAAEAVASATDARPVAIAVIDLDRFKEVNDTLGHNNGDRVLLALAGRLSDLLRDGDVVARLGGDEFGVILSGVRDATECVEVLNRLRASVSGPVLLDGLPLAVEASVGFALAPADGSDIDSLLIHADVAMYVAKHQHAGVVRYDSGQDQYDPSALTLVAELGGAIRDDELVLHYQPKTDLRAGRVTAVEALVRWQHPVRGLLHPDAFLPAAEQTELIEPLTDWVLRRAARDLDLLDPTGALSVAVNISARSLVRTDFADDVLAVLADTGTDPVRVILELTETALLSDPPRAAATLTRLHEAGVRISIDDFGAGQTSLGYLATLPVSELKIDKRFVLAMTDDPRNAAIVRSVIELGHSLGFTVTAEGVETAPALAHLVAVDCDLAQGFLLARPMDAGSLRDLLGRQRAAAPVARRAD